MYITAVGISYICSADLHASGPVHCCFSLQVCIL